MSYVWTAEQISQQAPVPYELPFRGMMAYGSFATTEDFVQEVLPPCLEPAPEPLVTVTLMAWIDWRNGVPSIGQRDRAALVGVNAMYEGEEGNYFLTVIEGEEINLEKGREFWGMPKRLGTVDFFDDGDSVFGYVERKNHRLIDFIATLGEAQAVDPTHVEPSVYFELKGYIAPTGMAISHPQLVVCDVESMVNRSQPITALELTLGHAPLDAGLATIPVGEFQGGAYVGGVDNYKIREVVDLEGDPDTYAPYVLGRLYAP